MTDRSITSAVEAADTDALLKIIDGYCAGRHWDRLRHLQVSCAEAVSRGKQLWAVVEHIRYRFALEGPGELAARSINEGPARFTLGPLPEVAASTHSWAELEGFLDDGPEREMFAHERTMRGEDLTDLGAPYVLETPLRLMEWEDDYALAKYESDRADFPTPAAPNMAGAALDTGEIVVDVAVEEALAALVSAWVEESNGHVEVRAVHGDARQAIRSIGPSRAYMTEIDSSQALAWMAWAAASGGAHGRRRGAAAGRFGAWWAATAICELDWPPDPNDLGRTLGMFRWILWSDGNTQGWNLRLAVEDPAGRRAWAISANDARL